MRRLVWFLILSTISFGSVQAQYVTFTRANNGTNNITVPLGEIWQLHSWAGLATDQARFFRILLDGSSEYTPFDLHGTNGEVYSIDRSYVTDYSNRYIPIGMLVSGPCTFEYNNSGEQVPSQSNYVLGFKKLLSLSSQANISANSVVIPTSVAGDVDVKMEQSADSVTWTECLPGTYNSSTVKRFFRLRAVEK